MKDWFLIPALTALFVFACWVMHRLAAFIEESQQEIAVSEHRASRHIRIAAETPAYLDDISEALRYCSETMPYLEFFFYCGTAADMLGKLKEGALDLALLTKAPDKSLGPRLHYICLPHQSRACTSAWGLSLQELEAGASVAVVWNGDRASKDRDRVLLMIENEAAGEDNPSLR